MLDVDTKYCIILVHVTSSEVSVHNLYYILLSWVLFYNITYVLLCTYESNKFDHYERKMYLLRLILRCSGMTYDRAL